MKICGYNFEEFLLKIKEFHGGTAPGIVLGGFMVDAAREYFEDDRSYSAYAESIQCLPDAIQILTSCTTGNKRLKVLDLGRYAIVFYDRNNGEGVRVALDTKALDKWPVLKEWYLRLKPKAEQDLDAILSDMKNAGKSLFSIEKIKFSDENLINKKVGKTDICPICGEYYPLAHGSICRGCSWDLPYEFSEKEVKYNVTNNFGMIKTPVEQSVGKHLLHDVTRVIPKKEKAVAFKRGHLIREEDVNELKAIGKYNLYLEENNTHLSEFIHEGEAALSFAQKMAGAGIVFDKQASEGKVNLSAIEEGLLVIDEERLKKFNMLGNVICASRENYSLLKKGDAIAGTRITPLYISKDDHLRALALLEEGPLFTIHKLRKARVGIIVTGTEVYENLVEEKYGTIMQHKVEQYGCKVIEKRLAPDSVEIISTGIKELVEKGADLIICTSGMSVDPDDVTVESMIAAGAENAHYGIPVLPGCLFFLGKIGQAQLVGVPASGLYDDYFSFDLLLPRLLANIEIKKEDFAKLGHSGLLKYRGT
jgi:formylmethanofuran dehydrogenase subunit E